MYARPAARRRHRPTFAQLIQAFLTVFSLAVLLCIYSFSGSLQNQQAGRRRLGSHVKFEISENDLVVAIPSDEGHVPLIQASWAWRKGIRSVIAVNDSQLAAAFDTASSEWLEQWLYYPDDKILRGKYPGDTRAALVPFLAHKVVGETYKWLLYGDDDTQWFIDGVLELVRNLDPKLPYFITDNLWWSDINGTIGNHPNLAAPRCLPCGFGRYGPLPKGEMQFNAPEGCPCTPQLLCTASQPGYFDDDCSIPLHLGSDFSSRTYSMHGGAGGLLSVGLLKAVRLEDMEECIAKHGSSTGGDAFLTICLWRLGFAHTDPGPWFNDPHMRLFDAAPSMDGQELAARLFEAAEGSCTHTICQDPSLLDSMVTKHLHSRRAGSMEKAAEMITLVSQAHQAYVDSRAAS